MTIKNLTVSVMLTAFLIAACDDDGNTGGDDGSTGGASADAGANTGGSSSGDGAVNTGGAANTGGTGGTSTGGAPNGGTVGTGTGGSPSAGGIPRPKTATVVVKTAAGPLENKTYELPDTGKFGAQRNLDEFFANFDGAPNFGSMFGGDRLNLRFSGFNRVGTFACGARAKPNDEYALQTGLELWTFENAKSRLLQFKGSNAGSSCSVTVTKLDATAIEGTYTAKLFSDAVVFVEISGAFHAVP